MSFTNQNLQKNKTQTTLLTQLIVNYVYLRQSVELQVAV